MAFEEFYSIVILILSLTCKTEISLGLFCLFTCKHVKCQSPKVTQWFNLHSSLYSKCMQCFCMLNLKKKKSYKSNYKQVDKSNIFVSVSTLKIQNYEMIISRIQTTVSYICNFYAWKWWYRQQRVNEWLNVCVYFHQNVTILCSTNHTNRVILTVCVYKRSLRWLFCITYIHIPISCLC